MKIRIILPFLLPITLCTEGLSQVPPVVPNAVISVKSVAVRTKVIANSTDTKAKPAVKKHPKPTAKPVASPAARIEFDTIFFNLGTIKEDAIIERNFTFTNVGDRDLVILEAHGSCGCTVPTYDPKPVPPGGKGNINVKYTAKNKVGPQKPSVTVTTNSVQAMMKLQLETWVDQIPGGVK